MNWRKPIIYSALYITGSKIPEHLKEIKKLENLSQQELIKYQNKKLKKILLHAWKHVPYYNRILEKAGAVVNGNVNLANFEKIPILTKDIIRKEGKNLHSDDHKKRKSYLNTSGGSTGEPVKFLQDKYYDEWNNATKIYFKTFAKQQIGDKELRLWGSERDLLLGKEKLSIRLRNWLYNRKELNAFKMSENDMAEFVKKWNKFKPRWIEAYVQSIYEFAKYIKNNKLKIYSPKGILTSAGTLYPDMKELIEEVFKCKVYNRYGSREVGGIACSDKNNKGLKLGFWSQKLEVLNDNLKQSKKNDFGKIIITNLNDYSMPLIRYDIGDIGVKGNGEAYLKRIEGREMSVFKTREGKIIPGEFFIHFIGVVHNKGFISQFQVIQKNLDLIKIKCVINSESKFKKNKQIMENSIKKTMGSSCKIQWEFVKEIKPLKNGKYLYTVSEI